MKSRSTTVGKTYKIDELEIGDIFLLMYRYFIIRKGKDAKGNIECDCLDDDGNVYLNPKLEVELFVKHT